MALHYLSIFGSPTLPDASGNTWFEPASITQTNDRYPQLVPRFKDTATQVAIGGNFVLPLNFVSAPTILVRWTTTATSGNAVWVFAYTAIAVGESLDPSTDQESVTVTTAAPGTSQLEVESSMSLTAGNFTAGDNVQFIIARNGAGADTIAADLIAYQTIFRYADT
jgi:hypothetical protein